jgi:hypothetical protein
MRVRVPGGHLRKAEAPTEAEAEKLLGENKTEKKRSFYEFKASLFSLWLTPRHLLRQRKDICAKASSTRAVLCYLYF